MSEKQINSNKFPLFHERQQDLRAFSLKLASDAYSLNYRKSITSSIEVGEIIQLSERFFDYISTGHVSL